jgi:Fe-S cluster assembly iron-binding protein IscA
MQMIEFTPEAIEAIKQYKSTLLIPEGYYLRIGIRQKNAQDKGLLIGFDEKTEKDRLAVVSGMEVIYHAGQIFFFAGMIIDYQDLNGRKGFKFLEKSKVLPSLVS